MKHVNTWLKTLVCVVLTAVLISTAAMPALAVSGSSTLASSGSVYVVTARAVNVRAGAGTKYTVVNIVTHGDKVTYLSSYNGWWYVRLSNGSTGYVDKQFFSPVSSTKTGTYTVKANILLLRSKPNTNSSRVAKIKRGTKLYISDLNGDWGYSRLTLGYYHLLPGIIEGERNTETGKLESPVADLKTYGEQLPFQHVYHYKAVWDNSLRLGSGRLKALVGYQQNRRLEYEESPDEYGLYFQLHTLNYDLRYQLETANSWKLAAGLGGMYQQSENKGEEFLIPAYYLFDMGAFATASRQWERWSVTGGLRIDNRHLDSHELYEDHVLRFEPFTRRFTGFSASIGAVYNVNKQLDLRANLSRGFRAPNMSELGSNGVHEGTIRYELGNHSLNPEESWQADLGADFSSHYVSAHWALFANFIDDYIYIHRTNEIADPEYATYRYDAGDARLMGFEAQIDVHPVHQVHIENTFGMVDAVQLHQPEETKYLPFTPAPRWTSELKYEFSHEHHKTFDNAYVSLGLECYLRQNHYYMADDTETATPSYTLFTLSAGTDLCMNGRHVASLYLTAQNLFDRVYQSHLSRLKYTDVNPLNGRMGISNMGRNICFRLVVPIRL